MAISPLAGKIVPASLLIDLDKLVREYYELKPDFGDVNQRVSFGTSGHRGTSANRTFNEAHILAIAQAVCDYRAKQGDYWAGDGGEGYASFVGAGAEDRVGSVGGQWGGGAGCCRGMGDAGAGGVAGDFEFQSRKEGASGGCVDCDAVA